MVKRDFDVETGKTIDLEPVDRKEMYQQQTDARSRFLPGNRLGGRPKGSRPKIEEAFLRDFLDSWRRRGKDAIDRACDQDPMGYVRIAASLLPRVKPQSDDGGEANVNVNVNIQVNDFLGKLQAIAKRQAELKMLEAPEPSEPEEGEAA
jgi:hypothetical protein